MMGGAREEAVWYYRLGEQTLGPVPWTEIEALMTDTLDGPDLLVARGGDQTWRPAQDILSEQPELASGAEPERVGWVTEPEAPGAPAAPETAGWAVEEGGPVSAEPAPLTVQRPAVLMESGLPREPGLGAWISQAWEVVTGSLGAFIGAMLLAGLVTIVSLGICAPALQAGLVLMMIKRFRGEEVSATTVFEGFEYFLPAWGLALLAVGIALVLNAPLMIPTLILQFQDGNQTLLGILNLVGNVWGQVVSLGMGAALFYALILIVDRNLGTIAAVQTSWETTKTNFLSYVGIILVLQLIAGLGVIACIVGVLVTAPLAPAAQVAAYRYHFREAT